MKKLLSNLKAPFIKHPASVGESYIQHALFASSVGFLLAFASFAVILHAVLPFTFKTKGSEIIHKLHSKLEDRGEHGDQ